jgi:hypothetical protein
MNVLWLGGGCGAGKSTMARRLAHRLDLGLYPVDAYALAHEARARPDTQPVMAYQAGLDFTARNVTPTVAERVGVFLDYARERFAMVLEDLAAVAGDVLTLAEGPWLLPSLVAARESDPGRSLWLLPTPEFTARSLGIRAEPKPTADESEAERADRLRLARDAELTVLMRRSAVEHGLAVYEVDGSRTEDETEHDLGRHFAAAIAGGARFRDGAHRAAVRRAENAVVLVQLDAFRAYLGAQAPVPRPPFPFSCECATPGCDATVPLDPDRYRDEGAVSVH